MKRILALILTLSLLMGCMVLPVSTASAAGTPMQVVGGWLRLRTGPSLDAGIITSYNTGTRVTVNATTGDWSYVTVNSDGAVGYMLSRYLSPVGGGGGTPSGATATVTSANGLGVRLRTGPGTGYGIIHTYPVGTVATIITAGTYWDYICINGTYGYMMSQFLSTGGIIPPGGGYLAYVTSQNGYGVRLRSGAGTNYSILGLYSVGTLVTVLQHGAVWDYIRIGTRTGYMMNQFLTTHGVVNVVSGVTINNTAPYNGDILTATVVPSGATVTYKWTDQNGNTLGTNSYYTVTSSDVGKYIRVTVTGTGTYTGSATSSLTAAVAQRKVLEKVTLDNYTPVVGEKLTASLVPSEAAATITWYRLVGTTKTKVGTGTTYTTTAADAGSYIGVAAVGSNEYPGTVTATTTATVKVVTPIIAVQLNSYAPVVGDELSVIVDPVGATFTAEWYDTDNNHVGSGKTYTVAAADVGKGLYVNIVGTGAYTGETHSPITKAVEPYVEPTTELEKVEISGADGSGKAVVGTTLTAVVTPNDATVTYQWNCDGTAISGATGKTYNTAAADENKLITVTATAYGDFSGEKTSSGVVVISGSTPSKTLNSVAIYGIAEVGQTLKAVVDPAEATVTYQWFVGGTAVSGETADEYVVLPENAGKTVKVMAIGTDEYAGSTKENSANIDPQYLEVESVTIKQKVDNKGNNVLVAKVTPADATVEYSWTIDSVPAGSSRKIILSAEDIGKDAEVTVTGIGSYKETASDSYTIEDFASASVLSLEEDEDEAPGTEPEVEASSFEALLDVMFILPTEQDVEPGKTEEPDATPDAGEDVKLPETEDSATDGGEASGSTVNPGEGTEEPVEEATVIEKPKKPAVTITGVSILGTPYVNNTLTAVYEGTAALDQVTYTWSNGAAVIANGAEYIVQESDLGCQLTVTVTSSVNASVSCTSLPTVAVTTAPVKKTVETEPEVPEVTVTEYMAAPVFTAPEAPAVPEAEDPTFVIDGMSF